ncbi:hypothetical protein ABH908_000256 [Pseudomonas frederiksbergensis]|uniref:hypothetical protein n=1 Tax=Pseudomonas TaxID=286 RepID=UPI003D20B2B8
MTNPNFDTTNDVAGNTRTRTGVVVTSSHPSLGPLYWRFVSEASVGGPDFYSITDSIEQALLLDAGWRNGTSPNYYGGHIALMLRDKDQIEEIGGFDDEFGEWAEINLSGPVSWLRRRSGQTAEDFLAWLKKAEWVDVPGPARLEQLVDLGFSFEWQQVRTEAAVRPTAQRALEAGV